MIVILDFTQRNEATTTLDHSQKEWWTNKIQQYTKTTFQSNWTPNMERVTAR